MLREESDAATVCADVSLQLLHELSYVARRTSHVITSHRRTVYTFTVGRQIQIQVCIYGTCNCCKRNRQGAAMSDAERSTSTSICISLLATQTPPVSSVARTRRARGEVSDDDDGDDDDANRVGAGAAA